VCVCHDCEKVDHEWDDPCECDEPRSLRRTKVVPASERDALRGEVERLKQRLGYTADALDDILDAIPAEMEEDYGRRWVNAHSALSRARAALSGREDG
jgi:hypothetical protein